MYYFGAGIGPLRVLYADLARYRGAGGIVRDCPNSQHSIFGPVTSREHLALRARLGRVHIAQSKFSSEEILSEWCYNSIQLRLYRKE